MHKIFLNLVLCFFAMLYIVDAAVVPSQYIIYAVDTCKIGERAGTTGSGYIGSAKIVSVGSDAVINGNIFSAGTINLFERTIVNGSVTAKNSINKSNGVVVTGSTNPNTNVISYTIPTKSFSTGTTNVFVPLDSTRVIAPGNYGDITISARSTVTFSNGIYNVKSLIIDNDVKVKLDFPSDGKIEINSSGALTIGDRVLTTFLQSSNSYAVNYYSAGTGTVRVGFDGTVYGNIVAPNALAIINSGTQFTGTVYAKKIELQPSVFYEADVVAPNLRIAYPINTTYSSSRTPRVFVKYSDDRAGIDISSLRIYINGTDRTSLFTLNGDSAVWQIPSNYKLPEGQNTIAADVKDRSANLTHSEVSFKVDESKPVITFVSPVNGISSPIDTPLVSVSFSDQYSGINKSGFVALLDGSNIASRFTLTNTTAIYQLNSSNKLSSGAHTFSVSISDSCGNVQSASCTYTVNKPSVLVSITSPVNGSFTNQNPVPVQWSVNGIEQTTQTTQTLVQGTNVITRSYTDQYGTTGTASVNVTLDTQAPVVVISSPANNSVTNNSAATVAWTVDGVLQTTETTASLIEGSNTITRSFADAAGNTGIASVNVTLDTQAPVVAISSPINNSLTNQSTATVVWTVDGVAQTTQTTETLTEGSNAITRSFTDAAGNTGTASVNVTLDTQAPVVAIISPLDNSLTNQSNATVVWTVDGIAQTTQITETLTEGVNTITRSITDEAGNTGVATVQITLQTNTQPLPPDPVTVAPKLDSTQFTSLKDATSFLYTGNHPIQTGVAEGTIDIDRAAVIRGKVLDRNNNPLPGVKITISGHPEFGQTLSRLDGMFDIAVNGGGLLKIVYEKESWFDVHRQIDVPWQNYAIAPDVIMVQADPVVTPISLTTNTEIQVMRASTVIDNDGTRTATILFPPGIEVTSGSYNTINVRATEYTVGPNGQNAMPAELPPATGYTYCTELSVDGVDNVTFNKPVYFYLENFLNFPVGGIVPVGYYSRNGYSSGSSYNESQEPAWIPSENGRIVKVLSIENNTCVLDVNGNGTPSTQDALDSLGITEEERVKIAGLYQPGQSLWRVPITHFTPWDCNWPYGPPDSAKEPEVDPDSSSDEDDPCIDDGSIIEVQNQVLREQINITGTSLSLNYSSSRVSGRKNGKVIHIPLTKDSYSSTLKRIDLKIEIAGKVFTDSFSVAPNLSTSYEWDGFDAYNRRVSSAVAIINVGYVYDGVYQEPASFIKSFSALSGVPITANKYRKEITLWKNWSRSVSNVDEKMFGLGGFSITSHKRLDPSTGVLYNGDGSIQNVGTCVPIIQTVVGNGNRCYSNENCGEDGPAIDARVSRRACDIAVADDGSVYYADYDANKIRKIQNDGILKTIAGGMYGGDTSNCMSAKDFFLQLPTSIAFGQDSSIYVYCYFYGKIYKIKNGVISVFAGNGVQGYSGDGGPAVNASISVWSHIAVGPDGKVYFTDGLHVRYIDLDGTINTIVGTGGNDYSADNVKSIAVDKKGNIYIGGYYRIWKIGTNGIITIIAGQNRSSGSDDYSGSVKAIDARFNSVDDIDIDDNGNIVFVDNSYSRVYLINQDGYISMLAGNGGYGFNGDNIPAKEANLDDPRAVAFGKKGEVYIIDCENYRIRKVMLPNINNLFSGELRIPSQDATLQYIFDRNGKHLRTENTLTNTAMLQFKYNNHGTLDSIVDASGNETVIERNNDGTPTAIVGPYGHRSLLTLNSDGYISSITNPAGEKIQMAYHDGGLLSSFTDAKGNSSTFEYDTLGRLIKDTDANGGFTSLQRVELEDGYEVRDSTAEGVVKVYKTRRLPDGTKVKEVQGCCGQSKISYTRPTGETEINSSDNTVIKSTFGPDPIFGMQSPLVKKYAVRLPSGLQMEMNSGKTVSYTSTNEIDSIIQLDTINGKVYKSAYAGVSRIFSTLTPEGRTTESTIDSLGRVIYSVVSDLAPVTYEYDERGRIKSIIEGSGSSARVWRYEYDNHGSLATVINPVGEQTTYTYDNAERIISKHFADMRQIRFGYDVNGNVQTITSPDNDAHTYDYNVVNLPTKYNPPTLNTGATPTTYSFNLDKDIASINRPDGLHLQFKYDDFGRLDSMVTTDGNYVYVYDPVTHKLVSSTTPDSNQLFFGYDGNITNSEISYGLLNDTISYYYNNNFQREARTIAGLSENYTYDNDGLMLKVGELNITRNPQNGLITGSTIGTISDALEYNTFGENTQYTVSDGLQNLFDVQYDRDKLGRITTKTEAIDGQTHTFIYTYNSSGYLERVTKDGATVAQYTFDLNGNRLSYSGITGNRTATYDEQDRMLSNGNVSYTYNVNGDLESKTDPSGVTTYAYDVLGNLKSVVLPGGKTIEYIVDDKNRRIGKKVNGVLVKKWVYDGLLKPALEYDGQNNVVARYVYGTQINVPEYMVKNGETFRLITDHLGSVRVIVNANTGETVQRIDYDEYGIVLSDNNPGFTPFGFAGGLYDPETGLVRFGARDYDAYTGRWTSKDPIGFEGGDVNLYRYVNSDPVNFVDPEGESVTIVQQAVTVGSAAAIFAPEIVIPAAIVTVGVIIITQGVNDICYLKDNEKASEDYAKEVAKQVGKDLGPDEKRQLHDSKNGGPDRTKEEIKQDARDLYDKAGKPYPKIIR